jgi:hypothetical protein
VTKPKTQGTPAADEVPKKLKSKHGLSSLALAHTPKRDSSKPWDVMTCKARRCSSTSAIRRLPSERAQRMSVTRYLKQIKARNTGSSITRRNVLMASIVKTGNFLHFEFQDTAIELEHLRVINEKQRRD